MRTLRTVAAATVALAMTVLAPMMPAQAAAPPHVDYTVSCGRITVHANTDVYFYWGVDVEMYNDKTLDGALVLANGATGVVATTRSTVDLMAFDFNTIEYYRGVSVPQNCAGAQTMRPVITGSKRVGATLTANPGTWVPVPLSFGYQWYRNGHAIVGATASTYTPVAADRGKHLKVTVTGSFVGYATSSRTSAPTGRIASGHLTSTKPTISLAGMIATAVPGTWGPGAVTLSYQWYVNGKKLAGARSQTCTLPASALHKKVRVRVTGTQPGFTTVVRLSAAVEVTPSA